MNSQVARLQHAEPLTLTQYTDKTLRDISHPYRNLQLDGISQVDLNQGELVVLTDQPEPRINGVYRISKLHDNKKNTPFVLKKVSLEKGKSFVLHITDGTHKGATLLCSMRDGDVCVVKAIGQTTVVRSASKKLVKTTSMQKLKSSRSASSLEQKEQQEPHEPIIETVVVPESQASVEEPRKKPIVVDLSGEKLVSLQDEIVSIQEQMLNTKHLDKLRAELAESQAKLAKSDREMADLLGRNQIKAKELEERLAQKRSAEERLADLEKHIAELDKSIDHKRNLEELENLLAAKRKLLADLDAKLALAGDASELQRSIKSQEDQISSKRKRLSMLVAELSNEDLSVKQVIPEEPKEQPKAEPKAEELKTEEPKKESKEEPKTEPKDEPKIEKSKKKKGIAGIFAKISKKKKTTKLEPEAEIPAEHPVQPVQSVDNVSQDYVIEADLPKAEVADSYHVVTQLPAVDSYKDFIDRAVSDTVSYVEPVDIVPDTIAPEAPQTVTRSAEFVMNKRGQIRASEAFYICKLSTVSDNIGCVGLTSGGLEVTKSVHVCIDLQYSGLNCQVSLYVETSKGKSAIPLTQGVNTVSVLAGSVLNFRCTPKVNGKMYDIDTLRAVLTVAE